MKKGEVLFGFEVKECDLSEELGGNVYELCHKKTNAKLLWLKREEENKTFCISFKTIPEDDTGVFHILEHSVLGGSEKYPVKEPFAELMKSSMATFLNAMTYPDKTVYPVSSRNEADFLNLVDVYLDAVFCPAIYTKPEIFWQEGWHYELFEKEEMPIYNGVVFNEMKGASSSVESVIADEMQKLLFPDTCYRFSSGGDPRYITELSYEQFLDAHRKYYHPSNAKIVLDGDLPIEKILQKLATYFEPYEKQKEAFVIPEQKVVSGKQVVSYEIGSDETEENRAHLALGMIAGTVDEKEKMYALQAISDLLAGSNEAPLKRAILDSGLGQDVSLELMDGVLQPWMLLQIWNTEPALFDQIRQTVQQVLEEQVQKGFDKELLLATLGQMEFHTLDVQEPRGIGLAEDCLESWLYDGDPLLYMENKHTFSELRKKVDTGYFEQLIQEILLDESRICELRVLPDGNLSECKQVEEEQRIKHAMRNWSEEEKEALLNQNLQLANWQQSMDSPEDLDAMPHLELQDISEIPEWIETANEEVDGVTILHHENLVGDILYLNLYFSLADLTLEEFAKAASFSTLLGMLPTKNYDVQTLQRKLKQHMGDWQFDVTAFTPNSNKNVCKPYFAARFSMLKSEYEKAVPLIREVLLETDFSEEDRIREILLQNEELMRQNLIMNGHVVASTRACSHHRCEDAVNEAAKGYMAYQWLKQRNSEVDLSGFSAWAENFKSHFCKGKLTIGITGVCDGKELVDVFPRGEEICEEAIYQVEQAERELIAIPAGIAYAVMAGRIPDAVTSHGAWNTFSHILSYEYLWNQIRVQGGAYGTGFGVSRRGNGVFYSYRDPSPIDSIEVYLESAKSIQMLSEEIGNLDRFVIGAVGGMEPLLATRQKGIRADSYYFTEMSREELTRIRRETLGTTRDDLQMLSEELEKMLKQTDVCVVGPEEVLEGTKEEWKILRI